MEMKGMIKGTITDLKSAINNMFENDNASNRPEIVRQQEHFDRFGNMMIDVETLSTRTNASIIEIAAVEFNKLSGEIGDTFDILIKPSEWGCNGRDADGRTVLWWMNQSVEAKKRYNGDENNMSSLHNALCDLTLFVKNHDNTDKQSGKSVVVWGNGATMDITILQSAYEHFHMETPWKYWAVNDCRTIVDIMPEIKKYTPFEGVKHSAMDDCKHQIKYVSKTLHAINLSIKNLKFG